MTDLEKFERALEALRIAHIALLEAMVALGEAHSSKLAPNALYGKLIGLNNIHCKDCAAAQEPTRYSCLGCRGGSRYRMHQPPPDPKNGPTHTGIW